MTCTGRAMLSAVVLVALAATGLAPGRAGASREVRESHPPPSSSGPHTPVIVVQNEP